MQTRFGFQLRVKLNAVLQHAGKVAIRAQLSDQSGGVPGRTAGKLVFFNQHDILPAHLGQMVGGAAADNTATDNHNLRAVFHYKKLPVIF